MEFLLHHEDKAVRAKLYAAAKALQQAVRENMVADAIFEIGSNLMGCEQIALLVTCEQQDRVAFVRSAGSIQNSLKRYGGAQNESLKKLPGS